MKRIDLHTHSEMSPDGGVTRPYYEELLQTKKLDAIAITDHNRIDFARVLHEKYGDAIIVGEEISTQQGDIIGLYLHKRIEPHQSIEKTIEDIKAQGGLVYIPHPLETVRSSVQRGTLERIVDSIDIIEVHNGRALFSNKSAPTAVFARQHGIAVASSSDAHGARGIGHIYSEISKMPTKDTLVELMHTAHHHIERTPFRALLYPKYHRARKQLLKGKK